MMNKRIISKVLDLGGLFLGFILAFSSAGCNFPGGGGSGSTQWYVAPSGNDANDCLSVATPCLLIVTAIQRAKPNDAVHLAAGTYLENLEVSKNLTIIGQGNQSIIDGSNGANMFTPAVSIDGSKISGLSINIEDLAIQNGTARSGGGVYVFNAAFVLLKDVLLSQNTVIKDNHPDEGGAGVYAYADKGVGGSFHNLNILNSTIQNNDGEGVVVFGNVNLDVDTSSISQNNDTGVIFGGDGTKATLLMADISNNHNGGLSVIYQNDLVTVTDTTIDGNQGDYTGGIFNNGDLTLEQSTISNNTGGVGGGLFNGYKVTAQNDTISGNAVVPYIYAYYPDNGSGGGIYNYGNTGSFDATNLTIANNSASVKGGGIYNSSNMPGTIQDTLFASNTGGNCAFSVAAPTIVTDMSNDNSCPGFMVAADPQIGPLADNGGKTMTHALLPGSPAIDAATGGSGTPLKDQRDVTRPLDGNADGIAKNDIGAYEFDPSAPTPALAAVSGMLWYDQCSVPLDASPAPSPLPAGCVVDTYGVDADALLEPGEPFMTGITVNIGAGDCPSGITATTVTDNNGAYSFSGLTPGKYCINVNAASFLGPAGTGNLTVIPSGHEGNTYRAVTLTSGNVLAHQDFAWYQFVNNTTPTPIPAAGYKFTPNINVNCHLGPAAFFDTLDVAMKGTSYPIDGRNSDNTWYRIMLNPNQGCWVLENTGSASGDLSGLRVLISPPTPTFTLSPTPPIDCSKYTTRSACDAVSACQWKLSSATRVAATYVCVKK